VKKSIVSHQLKNERKIIYMHHQRFLQANHPYRRLKKEFNGHQENDEPPIPLIGLQIHGKVNKVHNVFGRKKSVFFDLPYWSKLQVMHCIYVIHVEKNVCDNLIGTLLNIQGKTKDETIARLDLLEMKIRESLVPKEVERRTYLPPACYTMFRPGKISFFFFLKSVKVPQRYSSNIKILVSMQDLKLVGLKSHDCHIVMKQLLLVLIHGILC